MLKTLQSLFREQALIANSGVQFLDYGFCLDENFAFSRSFLEKLEERANGPHYVLSQIDRNRAPPTSSGKQPTDFVDSETGEEVTSSATYSVQLKTSLEAYDGTWLPASFLKIRGRDRSGRSNFEAGPSNWARLRVVKLETADEKGFTHRLTLAFDTRPERMAKGGPYACPLPEDVRNESRFEFAPLLRDNSWLLDQDWFKQCLMAVFDQSVKLRSVRIPKRGDNLAAQCAYWALYLVLLQGIDALINDKAVGLKKCSAPLPTLRFLNTLTAPTVSPIDVDLVLDIGNSRTCGVLVERSGGSGLNIKDATVLELRDLSRPQLAYNEPFRSHVEFVEPYFGNPYYDKASGREEAFSWPSLVRIGPEALRLHAKSSGAVGDTGLSSPKRYLWDDRENPQPWYFNRTEVGASEPKTVIGTIMELVTSDGSPVRHAGDEARPALQPKFSRASLFTFMVVELLLQAATQMNSPGYRALREHPDVPRRLRRVVFTIPTATPVVERTQYQKRCVAAVELLWEALEWSRNETGTGEKPEINLTYDEATCTQIVYLYNEVVEKYRKSPRDFFKLLGKKRKDPASGNRLRIASLDIGGGTTDLMILTYRIGPIGDALNPKQNFREGFRRAGDDILEAVISEHVLKPLAKALGAAGLLQPEQFLRGFMLDSQQNALTRQKRKLFVTRVLAPIALTLLSQYENVGMFASRRDPITFGEIGLSDAMELQPAIAFFEEAAQNEGARGFSLTNVSFEFDFVGLGVTTAAVMGPILSLMAEAIHRLDCDVLLMSGRPSRLPIVRDLILRYLPAPPHRVIFMHEYRVTDWYKFRGRLGTIEDPKTTVVMGALLCALAADKKVTDFALNVEDFGAAVSTANYIGRIFGDDVIANEDVIFARENGRLPAESKQLAVDGPMFLGFRQLPVERWPGTPLFYLDVVDSNPPGRDWDTPWRVRFRRDDAVEAGPEQGGLIDEAFGIDSIVSEKGEEVSPGRIRLRMQTLRNPNGYWLDTGTVQIDGT
jgi:hypothetical protein